MLDFRSFGPKYHKKQIIKKKKMCPMSNVHERIHRGEVLTFGLNNLISNPTFSLKMAVLLSILFTE